MHISSRPFAASARPAQQPRVWAPDAMLVAPPDYHNKPEESPSCLLGELLLAQKIAEQQANASTHPPYEPSCWAPDAVLAPPTGYQSSTPAPASVSFFGVELPPETLGLLYQRSSD